MEELTIRQIEDLSKQLIEKLIARYPAAHSDILDRSFAAYQKMSEADITKLHSAYHVQDMVDDLSDAFNDCLADLRNFELCSPITDKEIESML